MHLVHNAYKKGCSQYGSDVADLMIQVYNWFDGYPARKQDFVEYCSKKNVTFKNFKLHVPTRWLTLVPAAERFLEMFPTVNSFFMTYLPAKKSFTSSKHYTNISKYLSNKSIHLELLVIIESGQLFEPFLHIFQKSEPMIHELYPSMIKLIKLISSKICKDIETTEPKYYFDDSNLMQLKDIQMSSIINDLIGKLNLKESDKLLFISNYKKHFLAAGKYLISKSNCNLKVLKTFQFLNPSNINRIESVNNLRDLLKFFPEQQNLNEERIINEFKLLQFENLDINNFKFSRIDHFWSEIFDRSIKYENLELLVKNVICTSHGQADIERRFSSSKLILTDFKSQMKIRTLNAYLTSMDAIKTYKNNIHLIHIDNQLINAAHSAKKNYELFVKLEKEKKNAAAQAKLKEFEEQQQELKKKAEEEMIKTKKKSQLCKIIEEIDEKQNDLNEMIKVTDGMLDSANSSLLSCLSKTDIIGAKVAQKILESASANRLIEKNKTEVIKKLIIKRDDLAKSLK